MRTAMQFAFPEQQRDAAHFGMWVFLGTELLLFAPLVLGYLYGRSAYAASFGIASRHTDLVLGTTNTAVLLASSTCMALAIAARREQRLRLCRALLAVTALLGIAFLAIKGWEWRHDVHEHWFPGSGFDFREAPPALQGGVQYFFICYFAATGLHALHLAIGVTLVGISALRGLRDAEAPPWRLAVVGLYWHFVDVVWIFLFPALYLVERGG